MNRIVSFKNSYYNGLLFDKFLSIDKYVYLNCNSIVVNNNQLKKFTDEKFTPKQRVSAR